MSSLRPSTPAEWADALNAEVAEHAPRVNPNEPGDTWMKPHRAAGGTAACARVVPLIERCWPAICRLAGKIAADTVVRHSDVCEALGVPAKDNGHELALIRAGDTPGSFRITRPVSA